mmetsp:Transcript_4123/g.11899  ORF Transcript_4123/g.11899 Transcript_4123/m.11899 type:complete len:417 (-) Transcript_4123:64-1314(-)
MKTTYSFIIVTLWSSLTGASAWTATHHPQTFRPTTPRRVRMLQQTTTCWASNDHEDKDSSLPPDASSRRQWLAGMASAAVGVWSVPSLPAQAASLVSTTSVCDPSVSVWKKDGRLVYLLGTAHISSASAQLAGELVKDVHPRGVFVELDIKRMRGSGILANRIQGSDEPNQSRVIIPNIQKIPDASATAIASAATSASPSSVATAPPPPSPSPPPARPNPVMRAASQAVGNSIKGMYKKLDSAGFQAGEEFVIAIQEGQKIGSDIILGDRDVEVTLQRVTEGLAKTDLKALMNPDAELEESLKELVPNSQITVSNSADIGDLSDEEYRKEFTTFVETMKAKENVRKIMVQLQRVAPFLYEALVSERDAYMAAGLNGLDELETIVAVMGVAHVDGVEQSLSANGWKAVEPVCANTQR